MSPDDPRHGTPAGNKAHRKHGEQPCPPCARAAARYQNERLLDRSAGRPRTIPAAGTQLRLQALCALGHSFTRIAEALGISHAAVGPMATRPKAFVRATTAARIADLYDAWSMTLPPTGTWAERKAASYARNLAKRRGWLPPLALDDDRLDDPTYKPSMPADDEHSLDPVVIDRILHGDWRIPSTRPEREAVVEIWLERGESLNQLEQLTGWNIARYTPRQEPAA